MTMNTLSNVCPTTISVTSTMFGCCIDSRMFASRSAVSGNP